MTKRDLLDQMSLLSIADDSKVVSIEEARVELDQAKRILFTLQALQDEAHDLTEELEIQIEALTPNHPHVIEVANQLGRLVKDWQTLGDRLDTMAARISGFEPGCLEWHGVVDGNLVMYSWCEGESDIEWWHPLNSGLDSRRPLVEA